MKPAGLAGRLFVGGEIEELVRGQAAEFDGAGLGLEGDDYPLVGQLLGVFDKFASPVAFAKAVGDVKDRQGGPQPGRGVGGPLRDRRAGPRARVSRKQATGR